MVSLTLVIGGILGFFGSGRASSNNQQLAWVEPVSQPAWSLLTQWTSLGQLESAWVSSQLDLDQLTAAWFGLGWVLGSYLTCTDLILDNVFDYSTSDQSELFLSHQDLLF